MKIYIVVRHDWDYDTRISIWASKELAESVLADLEAREAEKNPRWRDKFSIQEDEVADVK